MELDCAGITNKLADAEAGRSVIRAKLASKISTLHTSLASDIKSNVNHIIRTAIPKEHKSTLNKVLKYVSTIFRARLAALETAAPPSTNTSPLHGDVHPNITDNVGLPPPSNDSSNTTAATCSTHARSPANTATNDNDGTFRLHNRHFGLSIHLGGVGQCTRQAWMSFQENNADLLDPCHNLTTPPAGPHTPINLGTHHLSPQLGPGQPCMQTLCQPVRYKDPCKCSIPL